MNTSRLKTLANHLRKLTTNNWDYYDLKKCALAECQLLWPNDWSLDEAQSIIAEQFFELTMFQVHQLFFFLEGDKSPIGVANAIDVLITNETVVAQTVK